jgi:hypothetical protein
LRIISAETLAGAEADSRARRPAPLEAGRIEELRVELFCFSPAYLSGRPEALEELLAMEPPPWTGS